VIAAGDAPDRLFHLALDLVASTPPRHHQHHRAASSASLSSATTAHLGTASDHA
jgi:hypothetical protein